jgi:hypothetical protein
VGATRKKEIFKLSTCKSNFVIEQFSSQVRVGFDYSKDGMESLGRAGTWRRKGRTSLQLIRHLITSCFTPVDLFLFFHTILAIPAEPEEQNMF